MKYVLIIFLLCIQLSCDAHVIIGEHKDWVENFLPKIEKYFKKPLNKELLINIVPNNNSYYNELLKYNVKDAKKIARKSYAVTSNGNIILINSNKLAKNHFFFILAHEMTHQYQFEKYGKEILNNRKWMEKDANNHAYNISKYRYY